MRSLSSLYLDAFVAVAQTKNFSKAAEKLHITQSALSQRVLNLEGELESTLFIRDRVGILLTEMGHELLRYCQNKEALENEFLSQLQSKEKAELVGDVRIGGFSSVMRSVILPALSPFLKANPRIRLNLITRELRDLPDLLRRGEIGFMVLDHSLERHDLESIQLGFERNVLVQSVHHCSNNSSNNIYLDHDEEDQVTRNYLKLLGKKHSRVERRYLGDVYGLLDGVRQGIGKAVLPRHLIRDISDLSVLNPGVELTIPVMLHFYSQPYYTHLQQKVLESLRKNCPKILSNESAG
jgi:DNA-binding transcriptional LysR family regulator